MKNLSFFCFIFLVTGTLFAGGNGGSTGAFLSLPAGARSASLGEGGVALTRDASALHLNPAAIVGLERASVVGTHGVYIDSSFVDHITYVTPKSRFGAWGVGLQYFSAGTINGSDELGNSGNNVSPHDLAITGGYGRTMGPVHAGVGVKYIDSKLVDSASTISLDLGIETKKLLNNRLTLGLVGQNLIGSLKYEQEENDLPMAIKAGAGYAVLKNWDLALDAVFPKYSDTYYSLGTEYKLSINDPWGMAFRGGYNTRTSDVGGFTGFSLGLGVSHKDLTVDYAFLPFGDVGTTHWISLGWKL